MYLRGEYFGVFPSISHSNKDNLIIEIFIRHLSWFLKFDKSTLNVERAKSERLWSPNFIPWMGRPTSIIVIHIFKKVW